MEKYIYYNNLYLIYKNLFNENMKEIFDLYYGENLSMQEIAEIKNISKSRVGVIIKNFEKKLDFYEENLNIFKTQEELSKLLEVNDIKVIKDRIDTIIKGD